MLERVKSFVLTRRGLSALIAAGVIAVGSTTGMVVRAATDGGAGDNNAAVAVNTKDDSEVFKLSFKVVKTKGDVSDPVNAAVAASSCDNCRTIAIAIEAVIVLNDPAIISPTNLAIAVNENCTLCETYADARQHVISSDGPAKFSAEGKARIKAISAELKALKSTERETDLTFEELKARVDALSAELADVLADEFMASSAAAPDVSPSASPTSPSPDSTAGTSSTPTPSDTSTPTDEPSATPTPMSTYSTDAPATTEATPGLSR